MSVTVKQINSELILHKILLSFMSNALIRHNVITLTELIDKIFIS